MYFTCEQQIQNKESRITLTNWPWSVFGLCFNKLTFTDEKQPEQC